VNPFLLWNQMVCGSL